MNFKILKEIIDFFNVGGLMYQYRCRLDDSNKKEAMLYVMDDVYDEFGGDLTDEIEVTLKGCINRALEGNDDFITHQDVEPTELNFEVSKFGDGIRFNNGL